MGVFDAQTNFEEAEKVAGILKNKGKMLGETKKKTRKKFGKVLYKRTYL